MLPVKITTNWAIEKKEKKFVNSEKYTVKTKRSWE